MKYLTGTWGSSSNALIDARNPMFQKEANVFSYSKYNYLQYSPPSRCGSIHDTHFSPFSQAVSTSLTVHNLCINWQ